MIQKSCQTVYKLKLLAYSSSTLVFEQFEFVVSNKIFLYCFYYFNVPKMLSNLFLSVFINSTYFLLKIFLIQCKKKNVDREKLQDQNPKDCKNIEINRSISRIMFHMQKPTGTSQKKKSFSLGTISLGNAVACDAFKLSAQSTGHCVIDWFSHDLRCLSILKRMELQNFKIEIITIFL